MERIRSKIVSLGLAPRVDELINEVGFNKNQITNRINEELVLRGQRPITYETVSLYLEKWLEQREEKVRQELAILPDITTTNEAGIQIVDTIGSKYDAQIKSTLLAAASVESGLITAINFYATVMAAGMAKILNDPDSVTVQDALKAAEVLDRLQNGKGAAKTILQNAIQINTGNNSTTRILKEADILDADTFDIR